MTDLPAESFRRLAEALPDGLLRLDLDARILYCNGTFAAMYGLEPSDLIGRSIPDLAPPDRVLAVREMIDHVVATREVSDSHELIAAPDSDVFIESRSVPELDADGNVESMLVVVRDVTQLRATEREVRESEERFSSLVRFSSDIITILEPDGTWRYSSPEGSRLLGVPEGHDPPGGIFAMIHPDDLGRALDLLGRAQAGQLGSEEVSELRIMHADGSVRILESVVQNHVDNPSIRGIVINSRDITERRRAEEAKRFGEESLRLIADAVPVGIFDVGLDGTRHFENRYMIDLHGDAVDDPGRTWRDLVHDDDHELVRAAFLQAVSEQRMVRVRHRVVGTGAGVDDGGWVELRLAPVVDGDGEVARILGTVTDVSAAVETEARLAAARDDAVEASRLKSQFLANVSHEIRTPLNAILGMAALLLDDADLSAEQVGRIVTLRSAGTQLLALLEDVLDLSRIEAGQLELDHTTVDLRQVVSDAVGLFLAVAHEKGIALRLEGADAALPLVVGDPLRLRQILVNLVSNAVKFTDHGSVRVLVGIAPAPTTGSSPLPVDGGRPGSEPLTVVFEVIDTGTGIPPGRRDQLFEPFRQGDASTTRRHGGTGLGLAITRELVEMMHGTVHVRSSLGEGSRFVVRVPMTSASSMPATMRPLPGRQAGAGSSRAAGLHVLVVEDNDVNRQVVTAYLGKLGCSYLAVPDGPEAVQEVADTERPFDVVLMDCQMPRMDGFEATRRIRTLQSELGVEPVRIVAVTAGAMDGERERCFQAGMDDYLAKPFTLAGLEQALLAGLQPRGDAGGSSAAGPRVTGRADAGLTGSGDRSG